MTKAFAARIPLNQKFMLTIKEQASISISAKKSSEGLL